MWIVMQIRAALPILLLLVCCVAAVAQISRDSWITDSRAFRVGDLLTVLIAESGSGSTNASTSNQHQPPPPHQQLFALQHPHQLHLLLTLH